jgi:hypothetical protein
VKNSGYGYKNSSPTEAKRTFIHQNLSTFIPKKIGEISVEPKSLHKISATYISVLEFFHIKIIFVSFSLCCKHFTSLAYEILYARKVDLLDKLKEVDFSQLFPWCETFIVFSHGKPIKHVFPKFF